MSLACAAFGAALNHVISERSFLAMKRVMRAAFLVAVAIAVQAAGAAAQSRPAPRPAARATARAIARAIARPARQRRAGRSGTMGASVLRIGHDYTLPRDTAVREVMVVFGDAAIEGRVARNVLVVFGTARLSDTAVIQGSFILIGGTVSAAAGARVEGDLVVAGGDFQGSPDFSPQGEYVVIGPAALGGRLDAIVPWITRGLLWGRPIVPGLPWVWTIVGAFFLLYLALGLIFERPVAAAVAVLDDKPLTAFLVGLLVLLLAGPLCFLLTLSIIGIAVVPFVLCALLVALILGKIGTARWIGSTIVRQDSLENRLQSLRSFVVGFAVICVAYMVPLLGFVAWGTLGVVGLGGSTLAFIAGYRRENPLPAPRAHPVWRSRIRPAAPGTRGSRADVCMQVSRPPAAVTAVRSPVVSARTIPRSTLPLCST